LKTLDTRQLSGREILKWQKKKTLLKSASKVPKESGRGKTPTSFRERGREEWKNFVSGKRTTPGPQNPYHRKTPGRYANLSGRKGVLEPEEKGRRNDSGRKRALEEYTRETQNKKQKGGGKRIEKFGDREKGGDQARAHDKRKKTSSGGDAR